MKRARTRHHPNNADHVGPLLLSFHKVRILNYIAAGPLCAAEILGHLRRTGHPADRAFVNRLLASMARNGWLKRASAPPNHGGTARHYFLTPRGLNALRQSKAALKVTRSL